MVREREGKDDSNIFVLNAWINRKEEQEPKILF